MRCFFILLFSLAISGGVFGQTTCEKEMITNLAEIQNWLFTTNATANELKHGDQIAEWTWSVDITPEHEKQKAEQGAKTAAEMKRLWKESACLNCTAAGCSDEEKRRVNNYYSIDTNALPSNLYDDYTVIQTAMANIYSTAKVCRPKTGECLPLDPDLSDILVKSKDYCELQWAWEGWRNESGRKMRGFYTSYVLLQNEAAKINGYESAKDMWTKTFWTDEPDFFNHMEEAWQGVLPLYRELHAYVRGKLMATFGASNFPASNHIPAHLFGNMWAQSWESLYPLLVPYPDASPVDLTDLLHKKGWNEMQLFKESDGFFQSIGLDPMTDEFWKESVFMKKKPPTEMVCHASAWNLYYWSDFRVKMCTVVSQRYFQTVHHEMGHVQYYMQYKDKPVEFKQGANPGFHEAIGDLIALSVMTPVHYKAVGLLPADFKVDEKTSMNALMDMALQKVAFLPFGYLMDKYRWDIFTHKTSFSDLNKAWWDLRCEMQGVSPPVPRSEDDFDPGAKYHIPASVPYDRYFFAHIAQFQFHRSICMKMGFTKDFHLCDFYNNKEATKAFRDAMALGSSKPYPEVLQMLTGTRKIDSSAIVAYFKPLQDWLERQNKANGYTVGWQSTCSKITRNNCNYNSATHFPPSSAISILMTLVSSIVYKLW